MIGGGGNDNTVAFEPMPYGKGAKWLVDGQYQSVINTGTSPNLMHTGETFYTPIFTLGTATQQVVGVGCIDGETAWLSISYYGP